jgi:hypothetical protein
MIKCSYTNTETSRQSIIDFINTQKNLNQNYLVIDIGGGVNGWTKNIADFVIDINVIDSKNSMQFDICEDSQWNKLLKYVDKHGLFDYCICTHTLEDIYNPFPALKYLSKISKSGTVTMPSIYAELSHIENFSWRGNIHHRWIYEFDDNEILICPKIGLLENLVSKVNLNPEALEIRFDWSENIPYKIFMNNYLGPDVKSVISSFVALFEKVNQKNLGSITSSNPNTRPKRQLFRLFKKIITLFR